MFMNYFFENWVSYFEKWTMLWKITFWDELCECWEFIVFGRWNTYESIPSLIGG